MVSVSIVFQLYARIVKSYSKTKYLNIVKELETLFGNIFVETLLISINP